MLPVSGWDMLEQIAKSVLKYLVNIINTQSSGVVGFDLGPPLQGQMNIAKLKSAYNSLIIGCRGLGW